MLRWLEWALKIDIQCVHAKKNRGRKTGQIRNNLNNPKKEGDKYKQKVGKNTVKWKKISQCMKIKYI